MRTELVEKAIIICVLFLLFSTVLARIGQCQPQIVTVTTDRSLYSFSDIVYVSGNLTDHGVPVGDGIVAIEVRDPLNLPFAFRTRPTGDVSMNNWLVNLTGIYPAGSMVGDPKYSFSKGERLYIKCVFKNFDPEPRDALLCITVYDSQQAPIDTEMPWAGTLDPNETKQVIFWASALNWDWASTGNATIYANLYDLYPKDGGFAWCPEASVTFTVTETESLAMRTNTLGYKTKTAQTTLEAGTYATSFKIPPTQVRLGNYTVHVGTREGANPFGELATSNTTFKVKLMGDINGDGVVDIFDAIIISVVFGKESGDPGWNPDADLNGDGAVDIFDAILLAQHFGEEASSGP